jgi:dihydropteroate synthase
VDTRHTAVMAAALDAGARIINDVSALRDPGALELVAVRRVPVVLMHLLGQPQDMQDEPRYACAPLDVWDFLDRRIDALEAAGGARSLALTDPGIGFGKTTAHNLGILDALGLYRSLGPGVLLGVSRKRLIEHCAGIATPPKQRLGGSLALALNGIAQGVDVVRVHDVAETVQAIRMWRAVCGEE